ncbi:MAG: LLM class F420-dependent oxidoreductase [Gammaproteobacteria bacterium]|jgi:F420-dependent oxidoreductase-like protein|nr:LLM class F420-dependent oxidoreductase [Gammaproteobacteria bacterium]MBK9468665.1 LLM class F420-dependent oxidoreductase [Gammaproteobacteria bacterium]MBP6481390.1 LLM class F420-dependent oxidoreductase [Pseudomonadales bacterium]MBP7911614.1 LLM class F420-dependent oxidoreductase [Pseudomonadales bacterium]
MKLGLQLGYWQKHPTPRFIELAQVAESLGFDSVWTAEAYGSDCFTPLAAIAASTKRIRLGTGVMQISARTPTCAAMTALTLDHISNGRLILGVGVSGPQVVEGWYGQPFTKPLERTREWIRIFRRAIAREEPLEFHGEQYNLPCNNGMGLGKPLKSITHPLRKRIPVVLGAEGPKNVALAAEAFDGWLPIFCSPYKMDIFADSLQAAGPDFEIAAMVNLAINDDLQQALVPGKWTMALYLGGMGAKGMNFHKNLLGRMGYADDAQKIQDLFLAGRQQEAVDAVPDALVDEISLLGPQARIRERLQDWKKARVSSLLIGHSGDFDLTVANMEFLARELL